MSPNLGKTNWTAEELDELRASVRAIMANERMPQRQAAEGSGVAEGTFGPWLGGKYQGDNSKVATKVRLWLDTRADRAAAEAQAVKAPDFLTTPTAKRYLTALDHAQFVGDMVLVAGGPGTGKTAALIQHQATRSRVSVATISPTAGSVPTCLMAVLEALGDPDPKGTPQALSRRIRQRYRERGALLAIDEAQHLSTKAIEELRSIHDQTGVGIAFVGDETLPQLFSGAGPRGMAQLSSRIGFRARQSRPVAGDVEVLMRGGWGISDAESLRLGKEIAAKPGALRGLTKVLLVAARLAPDGHPTPALIREAWSHQAPDLAAAA